MEILTIQFSLGLSTAGHRSQTIKLPSNNIDLCQPPKLLLTRKNNKTQNCEICFKPASVHPHTNPGTH
eukprot:scaffold129983_cov39-Attheya_sp.AAC.1